MAVIGPIARGAEDLELALDVIAGPDAGEDVAWRLQLPPARHSHLSQYRVAILPPLDWLPVDDEIMASLERLARELGGLGARVAWTQPEGFGDLRDLYRLRLVLGNVIDYSGRSDEDRRQDAESLRASGEEDMDAVAVGTEASAAQFILWHDERERYRAAYRAFFQEGRAARTGEHRQCLSAYR